MAASPREASSATARSVAIARKGARNLLIHAGILKGKPTVEPSSNLEMHDDDCFHFAEQDGMIEMVADLGETVLKGDLLARIWPADRTGTAPAEYRARRAGILASRHFPGLVKSGDCLAVIAVEAS